MTYIALAPPYGGSTYAVSSKLGGRKVSLLQVSCRTPQYPLCCMWCYQDKLLQKHMIGMQNMLSQQFQRVGHVKKLL